MTYGCASAIRLPTPLVRPGQQRPVTIYRFITKGTIEQRITELHAGKRDLADSLLDGADMSGKLSAEQLLRLIRE